MSSSFLILLHVLNKLSVDKRTLVKIKTGKIPITCDEYPAFLYEDGSYTDADVDHGFLRGHILLRVSRFHL